MPRDVRVRAPSTTGSRPSLVARAETLEGAIDLVQQRGVRRLLIVGRTGVGKSAFALALADALAGPVRSVPLADATTEHEVLVRLARALGVTEAGGKVSAAVADALVDAEGTLVLDDVDHVDDWAAVADLLDRVTADSDRLTVVATAIAAAGPAPDAAARIHLHPLAVPSVDDAPEDVLANAAVRLFVDRARQVNPTFRPGDDDARAIAELCRRLDGLPLAIKLAAARISVMQPAAMVDEMAEVGAWELVGLSLDDEVQRSIDQLGSYDRRVLFALDVFTGGASASAVHEVVGGEHLSRTIDALAGLVDLDLASVDRGRARYSLTSSTARVVRRSCDEAGLQHEHRARHAAHFATRARERSLLAEDRDLAIDHGNRLAAADWFRETGAHGAALRLLVDMAPDFDRRGEPAAGRQALLAAIARVGPDDARTLAEAHLWVARFLAERPDPMDPGGAVGHLVTARSHAEESGHEPTLFAVLLTICESHTLLGSFDLANEAIADGLSRSVDGRHPAAEVGFLTWKAVVLHQRGDEEGCAGVVAGAIRKAVALDDPQLIIRSCLVFLGLPRSVRASVVLDSPSGRELVEMARTLGDHRGEGWILALLTGNAVDDDDLVRAATRGRELLDLSVQRSNAPLGRLALAATVRIAARTGPNESAARLIGGLDRHEPALQASIAPHSYASYRAAVDRIERSLGSDEFRRSASSGRADSWDALVATADSILSEVVHGTSPGPSPLDALSPREREVLDRLVAGRSNKEIAADLGLRPKTVMHHCAAIYRKLDVSGRAGAVAIAVRGARTG